MRKFPGILIVLPFCVFALGTVPISVKVSERNPIIRECNFNTINRIRVIRVSHDTGLRWFHLNEKLITRLFRINRTLAHPEVIFEIFK